MAPERLAERLIGALAVWGEASHRQSRPWVVLRMLSSEYLLWPDKARQLAAALVRAADALEGKGNGV